MKKKKDPKIVTEDIVMEQIYWELCGVCGGSQNVKVDAVIDGEMDSIVVGCSNCNAFGYVKVEKNG